MKTARIVLIICELLLALTAIASGISMLAGVLTPSESDLDDAWFSSYTIPAVILMVVVGGLALVGAILLIARSPWAPFVTFSSGMAVIIWILVQMTMIEFSWLQPAYLGLGVVIAALSQGLYWVGRRPPARG